MNVRNIKYMYITKEGSVQEQMVQTFLEKVSRKSKKCCISVLRRALFKEN